MNEEKSQKNDRRPTARSWLNIILSTFAAFVGVQSDKNRQRDFQQKSILPFMLVGIFMAAAFIIGLIIVAKQIAP